MYLDLNRNLTEAQVALREQTHRFAEEVLRPAAFQLDKMHPGAVIASGSPLWDTLKEAYRQGYHARGFPEALGGAGLSGLDSIVVTEEIAWGSCDFAAALGVSTIPFGFLLGTGDPELIREFVVPFVQDRDARIIGCWAITEPNRGSDSLLFSTEHFRDPAINLEATARLDGDEWVLNGQKSAWVSNGTIATHALMNVSIDASRGMAGGGFCFIPLDRPGVTRGKPLDKLGQRALNQGQIFLEDVRIPRKYMLVGGARVRKAARPGRRSDRRAPARPAESLPDVREGAGRDRALASGVRLQPRRSARRADVDGVEGVLHAGLPRGRLSRRADPRRPRPLQGPAR
jgi:alkylation response protein AidB-like acyl-CoA dehydrogenase